MSTLMVLAALSSACSNSGQDPRAGEDDGDSNSAGSGAAAGMTGTPRACAIEAPTVCPSPAPVYADVVPIFERRCVVCHSGMPKGPWPLNTYGHVATWRDGIRAALLECQMPPADSGQDIPDDESLLILTWIRCGMPF